MYTETEAKNKWCPMTRHGQLTTTGGIAGVNKLDDGERSPCMGSGCMMWRWKRELPLRGQPIKEVKVPAGKSPHDIGETLTETQEWVPSSKYEAGEHRLWGLFEKHGFCGLAGTP